MKKLKKFVSLMLTLTMMATLLFATGMTAFAEESGYSLTITGTTTGHTYEAYQIFVGDLSVEGDSKVLSNVQWGTGISYTGTEATAQDVAEKLAAGTMTVAVLTDALTLSAPAKTVESAGDPTVINGLAAGYYLVKDKDGETVAGEAKTEFIVQVVGNTSVAVKSDVPEVEKKVKDTNDSTGATSEWQDSADYDMGDSVPYQITGTVAANVANYSSYYYAFTDSMSKGLSYERGTAKIKIGDEDVTSAFTESVSTAEDGTTVVKWECVDLKKISGVTVDASTKVIVSYNCTLNDDAVIGQAGNPNTVKLTFSNNPNQTEEGTLETTETPEDKNIVFTYKLDVDKIAADATVANGYKALTGAGFTLYKKGTDGNYQTVGAEVKGEALTNFTWNGIDDGDYKLEETTTPAGYNTIAPIEFSVSAKHDMEADEPTLTELSVTDGKGLTASLTGGTVTKKDTTEKTLNSGEIYGEIENKKGIVLPSTGGMGTTILYVAGAALILGAGALLILKRRRDAAEA